MDDEESRAWRGWLQAVAAVDAAVERHLGSVGLSSADWQLLVPLSESEGDALRARDLASLVGWDRSRLSHQLRRMEARGLLRRSDCATDARGTMVSLTTEGRALVERVAPGHVATVRSVFVDPLDRAELVRLADVCARVRDAACPGGPPTDCSG